MTVLAVEKILTLIKQNEALSLKVKYAYQVDWLLWQMGESRLGKMRPHHRVLSIYY
jgi:Potential Queuosine, Q, salvage protein family